MTRNINFLVLPFLLLMILPPPSNAAATTPATPVVDRITEESLDQLAASVGILDPDEQTTRTAGPRRLKIAIFDNGTVGFQSALGVTIPRSTVLRANRVPYPPKYVEDSHGVKMAEVFSNLLDRTGAKYDLHLFRSYGYSNLKNAIDAVIAEKFDLVLYAKVWEYGGNDDGRGFINNLVSKATAQGITWVNATGNFAQSLYRTNVQAERAEWAKLAPRDRSVRIRCTGDEDAEDGKCRLRLVLAWNSFSDDFTVGTDKDLDLFLYDSNFKQIASAELKQSTTEGRENESLYPRETIDDILVKPGVYHARVKIKSANFDPRSDRLRITAGGTGIELLDRTEGETLLAPADNPSVIPIGAFDSDKSSYSRSGQRPDRAASKIETESGGLFKGSSQASASFAARIALELTHRSDLYRDAILQIVRGGEPRVPKKPLVKKSEPAPAPAVTAAPASPPAPAQAAQQVRTPTPTVPKRAQPARVVACYKFQVLQLTGRHIRRMLKEGVTVETASGMKAFIDEDPFDRAARLGVNVSNRDSRVEQILVGDKTGFYATAIENRTSLPADTVEFVQAPADATYCPMR